MANTKHSIFPINGICCSCGYSDDEETPCDQRDDRAHCEHWYEGPDVDEQQPGPEIFYKDAIGLRMRINELENLVKGAEYDAGLERAKVDQLEQQLHEVTARLEERQAQITRLAEANQRISGTNEQLQTQLAHYRAALAEDQAFNVTSRLLKIVHPSLIPSINHIAMVIGDRRRAAEGGSKP